MNKISVEFIAPRGKGVSVPSPCMNSDSPELIPLLAASGYPTVILKKKKKKRSEQDVLLQIQLCEN